MSTVILHTLNYLLMIQYPVLSDPEGEVLKAYKVGRGIFGLTEVARVTFVIDKKGVVR